MWVAQYELTASRDCVPLSWTSCKWSVHSKWDNRCQPFRGQQQSYSGWIGSCTPMSGITLSSGTYCVSASQNTWSLVSMLHTQLVS